MIEGRWVALINQEIDGANSPEESRELARHLESDSEARALFDELSQMDRMFDEAGEIDPPSELHESIMRSVAQTRDGEERNPSKHTLRGLLPLPSRPSPRLAFATGLVAGACILAVVLLVAPERGHINSQDLRGTLVPGPIGEGAVPGDSIDLDLPGATGAARFEYRGDEITAAISLESEGEVRVVFEHGPRARFEGFRPGVGEEHLIRVSSGRTEIVHAGAVSYVVVFSGEAAEAAAITLSIENDQKNVLFRQTIRSGER